MMEEAYFILVILFYCKVPFPTNILCSNTDSANHPLLLQVFIAMSLILGDGLYNLLKIMAITIREMCNSTKQNNLPLFKETAGE